MIDSQSIDQKQTEQMQNEALPDFMPADPVAAGEVYFSQGLLAEARACFVKATEDSPGNPQGWNNLGVLLLNENKGREAERCLRQALEVQSDFLEARYNLIELYCLKEDWAKASKESKRLLEIKPGDYRATKRLAQIYHKQGQTEEAQNLLKDSQDLGALKAFIDSLWLGIKYHAMAEDLSPRDRLEKYIVSLLKYLDGQNGQSPRHRLVYTAEDGQEITLEGFSETFYYKESPSMTLPGDDKNPEKPIIVLTIGEHDDWLFFRDALRAEMRAEGGCLGNFTQTRKVLRREARLQQYDLNATLKYFQDNVGPCDCHVLRAVLT